MKATSFSKIEPTEKHATVFDRVKRDTRQSSSFVFYLHFLIILIELWFYDTSTLVGHVVSSPREREKRDRRDSRGDEREGQGRKENG